MRNLLLTAVGENLLFLLDLTNSELLSKPLSKPHPRWAFRGSNWGRSFFDALDRRTSFSWFGVNTGTDAGNLTLVRSWTGTLQNGAIGR